MPRKEPRKPVERIQVNKSDEIALVVERIIDAQADEVVLTIPRFSKLSESSANFHLIKREADLLKKRVVIESVDDKVIELAEGVDLESLNPILIKRRQFSDIAPAPTSPKKVREIPTIAEKMNEPEEREVAAELPSEETEPASKEEKRKLKIKFPKPSLPSIKVKAKIPGRRSLLVILIVVVGLFIIISILRVIPKADIEIITQKTSWQFSEEITLSKEDGIAQTFMDSRNLNASFPASGIDKIERSAGGTILVYNAYSSQPQPLVRRTRFVTPDGKIYRLISGITVPPAKIVDGEIIPSSIEADVIADEPGEEFNIGPIDYFSVPGFKGTAKFKGFYGELKSSIDGGFIGEAAIPTDGDIRVAKENVADRIEQVLKTSLLGSLPSDFVIVDGATDFQITKQNVITETDSQGNFSVFTEAEFDVIGFKETDVLDIISESMRGDLGGDFEFNNFDIEYTSLAVDFDEGTISLMVNFTGSAYRPIEPDSLREKVLGQSEADLQVIISSLPGFEDGRVSFWPFWVKNVPNRESRVRIDIL